MDGIANIGYDYEKISCSLSNDAIFSLARLSVTDLQPSELSENMHSRSTLTSYKTKMEAKVENPARSNLDIVPYISNIQETSINIRGDRL